MRVAVSRNDVRAREDARVVRVRDARRMRLAAMVISRTALQHQGTYDDIIKSISVSDHGSQGLDQLPDLA